MTHQLLENAFVGICLELDAGNRAAAHERLMDYGDAVEQDPELLAILRDRVYQATLEWLE